MITTHRIAAILLSLLSWSAVASEEDVQRCIDAAARDFDIPRLILGVIREVESGQLGKVSKNKNGTYDIGPMQINSIHLPHFKTLGIEEESIRSNACANVYAGAYIYSKALARSSNYAEAIARYHSNTPKYQDRYLSLVSGVLAKRLRAIANQQSFIQE